MSDPRTSGDIEDVLGSIRRLVSEEASTTRRPPRDSGRLVLTPAFRVGEAPAEGADEAGGSAEGDPLKLGESAGGAKATPSIAEELAELEARMNQKAAQWTEEAPLPAEGETEPAAEASEAEADEMLAPEPGEPEEPEAPMEEPSETEGAAPVEEEMAEEAVEPVEAVAEAEVEAETVTTDIPEEPASEAAEAAPTAEEALPEAEDLLDESGGPVPEAENLLVETEEAVPEEDELAAEAEEPAAQAEEAEAESYDAWEPADEGELPRFHRAGADVAEEPPIEAEVVRLATAAAFSEATENVGKPDVDSLLDENELRALVAEVLREELKGPLGERITRNVRKLVRREIAQALSSMDID
jgi:hypothetical protein